MSLPINHQRPAARAPQRLCSIPTCGQKHRARGLCAKHAEARRRELKGATLRVPLDAQVPEGHCWCTACRQVLPWSDFYKRVTTERSRSSRCVACQRAAAPLKRPKRNQPRHVATPDGHKWCGECGSFRPLTNFHKSATHCKDCRRWTNRLALYGITRERYEELHAAQGGKCAICNRTCPRGGDVLCVDHDHITGAIRGLLCVDCNQGLGFFGDNPERLWVAIHYLSGQLACHS